VQAVVLQDAKLAPEIIATLTEKKLGQAALAVPKFCPSPKTNPAALPKNAVAWAIDKVKAPDPLAPLLARLLHNVAIFPILTGPFISKMTETISRLRRWWANSFQPTESFLPERAKRPPLPCSNEKRRSRF